MERNLYGYARVSTIDQNLDRQLQQLQEHISDKRYIFTDKASGKDFNRKSYNTLVGTEDTAPLLHEGDILLITSLDRLGRNYIEIREQWEYITKKLKADIRVLDMPLLDTSTTTDNLDKRFIADLVLQILSYTAEKERENTRKRQRQGIDVMPILDGKRVSSKTGRPTGRPKAEYPDHWKEVYADWKAGNITANKAMETLELTRTTFYKLVKQYQ
ncbi:recombinase family protein [Sinanaerobacter chloroacetimidivorans]|uniref:Recombinase family protein n=1 Tax=Sinanaerobacter chloroacetimidivorans TaxID=2818044 RepID=A0A8J8B3A3_9FIRM|nr:recombinase family protein [Sinanaerobacter chloroacetimidivorans]MBR0598105.1 recombinase family protein [Sinanaerobacter chloroacetimidivorans]